MFKKVLLGLVLLLLVGIGVVAALASQKSDEFTVTRSIVVDAPASEVFVQVNDLEKGQEWSPWVEMDPDASYEFEGPRAGEGAKILWNGQKAGTGTMTIVESRENELVRSELAFIKPFEAASTAQFELEEVEAGQTKVTWTMHSTRNFPMKMMSVFMNCEKYTGEQFEKGLQNLKGVVEG